MLKMNLNRAVFWAIYIAVGVFCWGFSALITGYKFWGQPPSDYEGLDTYLIICGLILGALQVFRLTRILSWVSLPLMGLGTFVLFESGPGTGAAELLYQIVIAIFMGAFAYWLMKDRGGRKIQINKIILWRPAVSGENGMQIFFRMLGNFAQWFITVFVVFFVL